MARTQSLSQRRLQAEHNFFVKLIRTEMKKGVTVLTKEQQTLWSEAQWPIGSHMLRDVTYTFGSENRVQDCAVRPVAVAAGLRKVIRPVIMATGGRSKRSKVKGHVGTAIQHSYWAGTRLHPDLGAARLGQDLPGPARILMLDCLFTASDFGSNGPRIESGRGRCVESLDKALYSHIPKEKPSH